MTLNEKPNQIYPVAEPKEFLHIINNLDRERFEPFLARGA